MSNPIVQALMQMFQQRGNGAPQSDPNQPSGNGAPNIDPAKIAVLASRNGASQAQPSSGAPTALPSPDAMNMGMSLMNNPMAQGVPQASPIGGLANHPIVQMIGQALARAMQNIGYVGATPQVRQQGQELEQQKAQAIAQMAQRQQQLGYEGQRVGFEGQRTAADVLASQAAARRSDVEAAEAPKRTAVEQQRAGIEQQRADAEHAYQTGMLEKAGKQLDEEVRYHQQQGSLEQQRVNLEKSAQGLMKQRMQIEENHFDQQIKMQGLTFNRTVAEDERKQLHTSLDEWAKSNSWSTWLQGKDYLMQQHQAVDNFIDDKLRQVTGSTPFPKPTPGTLEQPNAVNQTLSKITGSPPPQSAGQQKPAYKVNGNWYDNPNGTGRPLQ
jgi:hypothetical protein